MSRYYNDYLQHSDEDTLAHFGIPGMKWGRHKAKPLGDPNKDRNIFGGIKQKYVSKLDDKRLKILKKIRDNDPEYHKLMKNFDKNKKLADKYQFDEYEGFGKNIQYLKKYEKYINTNALLEDKYAKLSKKYISESYKQMEKKYPGYAKASTTYTTNLMGSLLGVYGAIGGAMIAGKGNRGKGAVAGFLTAFGATHLLLRDKIEEDTKYQDNTYVNM